MTPQNPVNPGTSSPGELLSRRCVILLKNALKPELWQEPVDLNLGFFHKILMSVAAPDHNISNICTALELLTFLLSVLKKNQILEQYSLLQVNTNILSNIYFVFILMYCFICRKDCQPVWYPQMKRSYS